jgi:iron complex outermembrane receptor protein
MTERNPVRDAVRYALTAGVAASFAGAPAATLAQDDVAVQDKVTVTGSRIKRIDIEGPNPVSVISREDIDASGQISVAEVLRKSSFNSFGSFVQSSGSNQQSTSTVSLRGLGSQRTLVLIDGRRTAGAPTWSGDRANLNAIPLAAVERIEVLRDGASAIYGSDAIGGVINIILRKDYEGMHLSYGIGRPTQSGGDENSASIVGGVSGAKGNITFGFDWSEKQMIFNADRSFSAIGLSPTGFPGTGLASLTTNDPRNPARAFQDDTDGDGTADSNLGPTFFSGGFFPDARCPSELGADPKYSASVLAGDFCRYNFAGVSANDGAIDQKSFFLNANYDITESTTFWTRGSFNRNEQFGRYAGTPMALVISADNANNPTLPGAINLETGNAAGPQNLPVDTDGDGTADSTVDGPYDVTVFYRNWAAGFRDAHVEDTAVDYQAGLQGTLDFLGGMDWEVGAQWAQQNSNAANSGNANDGILQGFVDSGALDLFGVSREYPNATDLASQEAGAVSVILDGEHRIANFDAQVTFDAFQMNAGPVPVALGMEYRDEAFKINFDEQANAGQVSGSAGGEDVTGARVVKSLFAETSIPVFSMLDLSLAARYDDYNDFGTTINPKVAAAFRPLDSLLLRGSWGQGYRAPNMSELYSGQSQSFNAAIDTRRCAFDPAGDRETGRIAAGVDPEELPAGNPCLTTQQQNLQGGNRDLGAEESEQWTVGLVWNPLDDLSIALDWFDIELTDEIGTVALQTAFDNEFAADPTAPVAGTVGLVTRATGGIVLANGSVNLTSTNIAKRETDGLDVDAQYAFSIGSIGDFRATVNWTYTNEYERDEGDGRGLIDPPFYDPEHRGNVGLNWALGDFSANVLWNYVSSTSRDDTGSKLDDFSTVDLQVAYATPWNGTVTIGARNIFDEDPPTSTAVLDNPYYSNSLHDIYGRVPYIRYEQDL